MAKQKMHESITLERVMEACTRHRTTLDDPGICIACGVESSGHEPDARNHKCESCGERKVFGAEELLLMIM